MLSDAHGNAPAFQAGIGLLASRGATDFLFLGDSIGYIPSNEVVSLISDLGNRIFALRGNHEEMLLRGVIDVERDKVYQLELTRNLLTQQNLAEISNWPTSLNVDVGDQKISAMHGSPADLLFGYVYPDSDLLTINTDADIVFMGNTHRAFQKQTDTTLFVNVGSCGLPRDDGRFGSVALWNTLAGSVELIRFDIRTQTADSLAACPPVHDSVHAVFGREFFKSDC